MRACGIGNNEFSSALRAGYKLNYDTDSFSVGAGVNDQVACGPHAWSSPVWVKRTEQGPATVTEQAGS